MKSYGPSSPETAATAGLDGRAAPGLVLPGAGRFSSSAAAGGDIKSIAAMQAAFAANSTLCLAAFPGDWQIGAWSTHDPAT